MLFYVCINIRCYTKCSFIISFVNILGEVNKGTVIDEKPNGKGKETRPNGQKYEGEWFEGFSHGKGKLLLPDGSIFEGEFNKGKFIA